MSTERGKTNWLYTLIAVVLAVVVGSGILFMNPDWLSKKLAASGLSAMQEPIPMPKEINTNFLNQVNECFIPATAAYGYTLRITSGFRSIAEQDQAFNQGRTENGHIVTWAESGKSLHNYGFAVDVVDRWRGYNINWKRLGKIGVFCGLEQVDDPHFEHRSGLATADFAVGMRPPPMTIPCSVMGERAKAGQPLTLEDLRGCGAPSF